MKPHSLPKSILLTKPGDYQQVYRQGKRLQGANFSLIFMPNSKEHNRLGISIHGQLKGAVKRNRIKRIIREFYRHNKTFLNRGVAVGQGETALDIVFTIRPGFNLQTPSAVAQAVSSLLNKC